MSGRRERPRERMMARAGMTPPRNLGSGRIDMAGHSRTYLTAPVPRTGCPGVPYGGGPIGPIGRLAQRRATAHRRRAGLAVPVETVAADWAAANGCAATPVVEGPPNPPGDLPVTRMSWVAPGRPPVALYRIAGDGHTWPGGAQYLPARLVGPVARQLDATAILLDAFSRSGP